jgi:hypothetical protein
MPLSGVLNFASQILSALSFAHQASVVHRDIKPSNIMITESDVVKLLDFGIAISDRSIGLTTPGFLLGSLNYMSPEQLNGEKATARSDIYSVAVTLYEVLTGRLPFTGATNYEIMLGHLQRTPVTPMEVNAVIPPAVSQAVMRALAKDPQERFATARAFHAALQGMSPAREQTLPQRSVSAPMAGAATATGPSPQWTRRVPTAPNPSAGAEAAVFGGHGIAAAGGTDQTIGGIHRACREVRGEEAGGAIQRSGSALRAGSEADFIGEPQGEVSAFARALGAISLFCCRAERLSAWPSLTERPPERSPTGKVL